MVSAEIARFQPLMCGWPAGIGSRHTDTFLAMIPGSADYDDIIEQRSDLGTVARKLGRGLGRGGYKSLEEAWADAQLCFANCIKYNSGPADEPARAHARTSAVLLAKEWRRAGLRVPGEADAPPGAELQSDEASVPAAFSLHKGELRRRGLQGWVPCRWHNFGKSAWHRAPLCMRRQPAGA